MIKESALPNSISAASDGGSYNALQPTDPNAKIEIIGTGQEKITDQNSERSVNDCFGGGAADTDRAFARGQSFVATDEDDENAEAKCFREAHDNVAASRPADHVGHVISSVHFEHKNRDEVA